MKIPIIEGIIDRRILVNYVVDPIIVQKIIPLPFRPKIYDGKAVAGICLIRLKKIRPKGLPAFMGLSSENGAHRFAVEWTENGKTKEGVYIPRRDSSLLFNNLVGGRLFPGKHFLAKFDVQESAERYNVSFTSTDNAYIKIEAKRTDRFNPESIFKTLENASLFFQGGSHGYSPNGAIFEGLELTTFNWKVEPMEPIKVQSSFFEDQKVFPPGSIQLDNILLMKNISHEWHSIENKKQA